MCHNGEKGSMNELGRGRYGWRGKERKGFGTGGEDSSPVVFVFGNGLDRRGGIHVLPLWRILRKRIPVWALLSYLWFWTSGSESAFETLSEQAGQIHPTFHGHMRSFGIFDGRCPGSGISYGLVGLFHVSVPYRRESLPGDFDSLWDFVIFIPALYPSEDRGNGGADSGPAALCAQHEHRTRHNNRFYRYGQAMDVKPPAAAVSVYQCAVAYDQYESEAGFPLA